jgi:hypothetical protein
LFLYLFVNLKKGDLCKITSNQHQTYGQIVRFRQVDYFLQCPCLVFETFDHKRAVVNCESQFLTLPYKGSLMFLINLALEMKDRVWFDELVNKLQNESE